MPSDSILSTFLEAADDANLLSPMERKLADLGTKTSQGLAIIRAERDHAENALRAIPQIAGGFCTGIGTSFTEVEVNFAYHAAEEAIRMLRDGSDVVIPTHFLSEALGVSDMLKVWAKWDATAIFAAKTQVYGDLDQFSFRAHLKELANIVNPAYCRLEIDCKVVNFSTYEFYEKDNGGYRRGFRGDDTLKEVDLFCRVLASIHTDTPFRDCKVTLPALLASKDRSLRYTSGELFRWHEANVEGVSSVPGVKRFRLFAGGRISFEIESFELFRRVMAEILAVNPPKSHVS